VAGYVKLRPSAFQENVFHPAGTAFAAEAVGSDERALVPGTAPALLA
jgi:hypothetical protein